MMKFIGGLFVGALLALSGGWFYKNGCPFCEAKGEGGQAQIGEIAPSFALPSQNGTITALQSLIAQNKPIVLEWFNKDCPYVKKFYASGKMQELQEKYALQGVTWVRVISSAPGKQGHLTQGEALMLHELSAAHDTLRDETGEVGRLYGARTTPHMYVLNASGILVYQGAIDSIRSFNPEDIPQATNYVAAALDAVLKGEAVATPQTEAYGCSIKY